MSNNFTVTSSLGYQILAKTYLSLTKNTTSITPLAGMTYNASFGKYGDSGLSDTVKSYISLKYNTTTKKYEAPFYFSDTTSGGIKKYKYCIIDDIFKSQTKSCGLDVYTNAQQIAYTYSSSNNSGKFCFKRIVNNFGIQTVDECVTYKYSPQY